MATQITVTIVKHHDRNVHVGPDGQQVVKLKGSYWTYTADPAYGFVPVDDTGIDSKVDLPLWVDPLEAKKAAVAAKLATMSDEELDALLS